MSKKKTKKKEVAKAKSSAKKVVKKAAPKKAAVKKVAAKAAPKTPFHNNRLRVLRTAHGVNTIELAKKIKSTKQTISAAEINSDRHPSDDFVKKVAAYFKVPVTFFSADKASIHMKGDKFTVEVGK